jgi:hypothetical protein
MKVISSGHLDFKAGDLVWGMTGWEEYTLINNPESLFKINYPEFPLSNYTGVLGKFTFTLSVCILLPPWKTEMMYLKRVIYLRFFK